MANETETLPMKARIFQALLGALLACAFLATDAVAASTKLWTREGPSFRVGTLEGMAISPRGTLVPGAGRVELARPETGVLWKARLGEDSAWIGSGESLGLLSLPFESAGSDESGTSLTLDEKPDVFAVALSEDGAIYAGTGPEAGVYRVYPDKNEADLIARLDAQYVWDMVVLPSGRVAVATGLPATVQSIDPSTGEVNVLWVSNDPHIRCLALAPDGTLYAGTAGSGLVARIEEGGRAFVLIDSVRSETASIAVDAEGVIWAAFAGRPGGAESGGTGEPSRSQPSEEGADATITVRANGGDDNAESREEDKGSSDRKRRAPLPAGGGVLVRMEPGQEAQVVWSDGRETPFALALNARGEALMGTATPARVWWIDARGGAGWWAEFPEVKAVSAIDARDDKVLVATSQPASVSLFSGPSIEPAAWTSDVLDTETRTRFGRVLVVAESEESEDLRVLVRAGNTSEPGSGWTPWTLVPDAVGSAAAGGGSAALPRARFFQARVEGEAGAAVEVASVNVRYRPNNRPPALRNLAASPPGLALRPVPPPNVASGSEPVVEPAIPGGLEGEIDSPAQSQWRSKKAFEPGALSLNWESRDPDGDDLEYRLEYCRTESFRCASWQPLEDGLTRTFHSFDARSLPDGVYLFRLEATDAPSNFAGEELQSELISTPVVIDNSPPLIESARLRRDAEDLVLEIRARDEGGRLALAQVALGQGPWKPLPAEDGVDDGAKETWRVRLGAEEAAAGVRVRVVDESGNVTVQRAAAPEGEGRRKP
jgi:hypothetical protein